MVIEHFSETLDRHFAERASTWTARYQTHPSFRARLDVVGRAIDRELARRSSSRVLDYGGGTGVFAELAARRAELVVCMDRSLPMLIHAKSHPDEVTAILSEAGYPNQRSRVQRIAGEEHSFSPVGHFDVILAIAVLEYVEDAVGLMRRLATLLRPGGCMMITVPDGKSPLRRLQRAIGPVAATRLAGNRRFRDQSFVSIRPHGDRVPWQEGARLAQLTVTADVAVPIGPTGLRSRIIPTRFLKLEPRRNSLLCHAEPDEE